MPIDSKKKRNKKAEILDACATLFDHVGYHKATMQLIGESVGLGKPTLYHYFRSKSEILFAIHQDLISFLLDSHIARERKELEPDELLLAIAEDIMQAINKHPGYVRAFFEHFDDLEDIHKKEIREKRNQYLNITEEIIRQGIASGLFKKVDSRTAALGFLGMVNWTYKWSRRRTQKDVKKTARTLGELFLGGLKQ